MNLPSIQSQTKNTKFLFQFDGLNLRDADVRVADNFLSDAQNILLTKGVPETRPGTSIYGSYLGGTTKILGLYHFRNSASTDEFLAVYDTGVYRYVTGTWTALTSVTMTTNLYTDAAYNPITDKFYILNGTDSVVKYTSSTAGDQTDSSFKKGTSIAFHKNRLLVGVGDILWYTDENVDTFTATNYSTCEGKIIGIINYYNSALIFTQNGKIYNLQNYTFNGTADEPVGFQLPTNIVAIAQRSIKLAPNGKVYFIGAEATSKAAIYSTDGTNVYFESDAVSPFFDGLAAAYLSNACAGLRGSEYWISITNTGSTTNDIGIVFDTNKGQFISKITNITASYFASFPSSGQVDLYFGSPTVGSVKKIDDTVTYDTVINQQYATGYDDDPAISSTDTWLAQSFQVSKNCSIYSIQAYLKKYGAGTGDITVTIETDDAGEPSGTTVTNGTATITGFASTSYSWKEAIFSTSPSLSVSTTYWLVLKTVASTAYSWSNDSVGATYANGKKSISVDTGATWTPDNDADLYFQIIINDKIESYATTAMIPHAPEGQKAKLIKIYTLADGSTSNKNLSIGVANEDSTSGFSNNLINLKINTTTWGGGGTWGGASIWGSSNSRINKWFKPTVKKGRYFKYRFYMNDTFAWRCYGLRAVYRIIKSLK